jgi:glycerol-3-phosphate acyltransferase PlsY
MPLFIILCIIAYIAGSINFSIILFKVLKKPDPRKNFSGNPGATNVYRQAGLFWAAVIVLLDVGRAMGIGFAALYTLPVSTIPWVGFCLILGNSFPCFHGFQGGKGVANYLGFTAVLTPVSAAIAVLAWGIAIPVFRTPFIASFFMIFILAGGTIIAGPVHMISATGIIFTALFIFWRHRQNIQEFIRNKKPS